MDDWKARYPRREDAPKDRNGNHTNWPFMGYLSEMVNLSLLRDDPEGFIGFMREAGLNRHTKTFDGLSMESYCNKRNAVKCKAALSQLD